MNPTPTTIVRNGRNVTITVPAFQLALPSPFAPKPVAEAVIVHPDFGPLLVKLPMAFGTGDPRFTSETEFELIAGAQAAYVEAVCKRLEKR
ncbi:MAG: hypothetical protein WAU42_14700 [Solirubrobacteraceae bacterium]